MNKNTLIAFILVLITVAFFSSPVYNRFYYENILKRPYPGDQKKNTEQVSRIEKKPEENKIRENEQREESPQVDTTQQSDENQEGIEPTDTVWIETEKMIVGISEMGANIKSLKMKEYHYDARNNDIVNLISDTSSGGAQLSIAGNSFNENLFQIDGNKSDTVKINKKGQEVTFSTKDNQGRTVQKQFLFDNDSYKIGMRVMREGLSGERISVSWDGIRESETDQGSQQEQKVVHFFNGENVQHIRMNRSGKEEVTGFYRWIGITSKYFFVNIVADTLKDADLTIRGISQVQKDKKGNNIDYIISFQHTVEQNRSAEYWFYTGPNQLNELKSYGLRFEKILFPVLGWTRIFFWADRWFPWIAEFVLWLLLTVYNLVRDYGVAILLITLISKVVTFPMTQSSTKSMSRMKDIQPKVNALRNRYKNNPKKMNEEIMALYREEGINPLNPGCLPLFLQMPIFIALFVVLRKAIELRGAETILVPWIHDLSQPEVLISLRGILPGGGIPLYGNNIALLPIIMAVLTFFQNKMTIKDPNQKAMIYFMPVFMLVLFNNFPAGLVLYWTFSSALGLVQQYYTNKQNVSKTGAITTQKK